MEVYSYYLIGMIYEDLFDFIYDIENNDISGSKNS